MAFRTAYTPLYRDADESGRVGTLGLLAMLQESVLGHAAALGLDHDDLVRTRGIGWMFARYRLAVRIDDLSFDDLSFGSGRSRTVRIRLRCFVSGSCERRCR